LIGHRDTVPCSDKVGGPLREYRFRVTIEVYWYAFNNKEHGMSSNLSKAVQIERFGGPEEMKLVGVSVGEPGAGEVRIRHKAVGLNFIDVYQRTGLYPLPLPLNMGMEASGVIEAVGSGVTHLKIGDRAAYASQPPGSYCESRVMPARCVCKLPDDISFETGAAMMLKGMTVQYLLRRTLPQAGLQAGDFVLFHAAAGGVGLIACQWARALGLQLIGTAWPRPTAQPM
jgi:NADPH2:quinone reductase